MVVWCSSDIVEEIRIIGVLVLGVDIGIGLSIGSRCRGWRGGIGVLQHVNRKQANWVAEQ